MKARLDGHLLSPQLVSPHSHGSAQVTTSVSYGGSVYTVPKSTKLTDLQVDLRMDIRSIGAAQSKVLG